VVSYEKIPKVMVQAVLAAEDAQFFRHKGLNYGGMIRAFWVNMAAGRFKQGGSTITQQVVKGLLLTPERSLRRKFQEVILARRVESALSKEQILAIYLNEIYFGHGRYGVEEAARFYFRKPISGVTIAEAALLAALPQGPEVNSPIKHPEKARERQAYVLSQMARHGFISEPDVEAALKAPLLPGEPEVPDTQLAPELVTYLTEQHATTVKAAAGKEIVTTLDLKLQAAAREALGLELRAPERVAQDRNAAGGTCLRGCGRGPRGRQARDQPGRRAGTGRGTDGSVLSEGLFLGSAATAGETRTEEEGRQDEDAGEGGSSAFSAAWTGISRAQAPGEIGFRKGAPAPARRVGAAGRRRRDARGDT